MDAGVLVVGGCVGGGHPVRTHIPVNAPPYTYAHNPLSQVLFLLYHYFQTHQLYNAIRVFIAAYVWMTGFGNFAYYYKTNDFHLPRFFGMMWRLNFLVTFACLVLRNSYMLYYICPMHTLFTLMVYAALGIAKDHNKKDWVVWTKLGVCVVVVYVCWDVKPVFYALWSPWTWLMGYTDPRRPSGDPLHGVWGDVRVYGICVCHVLLTPSTQYMHTTPLHSHPLYFPSQSGFSAVAWIDTYGYTACCVRFCTPLQRPL